MFAVEILWHTPLCLNDRPSSAKHQASEEAPPQKRLYSFGAAQVKLAASLCSPFPEKTATAG
jgi:hypothetical protein